MSNFWKKIFVDILIKVVKKLFKGGGKDGEKTNDTKD